MVLQLHGQLFELQGVVGSRSKIRVQYTATWLECNKAKKRAMRDGRTIVKKANAEISEKSGLHGAMYGEGVVL